MWFWIVLLWGLFFVEVEKDSVFKFVPSSSSLFVPPLASSLLQARDHVGRLRPSREVAGQLRVLTDAGHGPVSFFSISPPVFFVVGTL